MKRMRPNNPLQQTAAAAAELSLGVRLAISTFDTDYLLVMQAELEKVTIALRQAGHSL